MLAMVKLWFLFRLRARGMTEADVTRGQQRL